MAIAASLAGLPTDEADQFRRAVTKTRTDDERLAEHRRVLSAYDLPLRLPGDLDPDELLELFGRDKKAIEGLTLVLDGAEGVEPVVGIDRTVLREVMEAVR